MHIKLPIFVVTLLFTLKMVAVLFSKTFCCIYEVAQWHNTKNRSWEFQV